MTQLEAPAPEAAPVADPAPSWWGWAVAGVAIVAVFDAFWRLGTADWKVDESLDGAYGWAALHDGNWRLEDGHPVIVRWLFGAGQVLFGENRFGIRFAGAVAAVAAVWLLYLVGKRLHSRAAGLVAAALWAVLPRALMLGHAVVGPLR